MKRILTSIAALLATLTLAAQTLNVKVGNVTYLFPAAQTGEMTYADGTTLTIMGKVFTISDISSMTVDNTEVTDNLVTVAYSGTSAAVTVAGNVAQYVEPSVSGAYVSIAQSNTDDVDDDEITYQLSGTSTDGQFALSGSYKCTVSLAGVNLTCATDAAISITDKKRIQLSAKNGTENTLTDCASGSQKACIYSKGQLQLQGKGTLNVVGKTGHAIKSADYITVKNLTLNITGSVSDGINCNGYFQMTSGTVSLTGVGDDGIQCDLDGDTATEA
ncbi:MAG: carbohydrate-binding domain-containing protein, partial [Bacteroidaceae bacterium]|nr:carbohydrate-binding domain-containing protein [Bacteroidaceae bacterium]